MGDRLGIRDAVGSDLSIFWPADWERWGGGSERGRASEPGEFLPWSELDRGARLSSGGRLPSLAGWLEKRQVVRVVAGGRAERVERRSSTDAHKTELWWPATTPGTHQRQ